MSPWDFHTRAHVTGEHHAWLGNLAHPRHGISQGAGGRELHPLPRRSLGGTERWGGHPQCGRREQTREGTVSAWSRPGDTEVAEQRRFPLLVTLCGIPSAYNL